MTKWEVSIQGDEGDLEYLAAYCTTMPLMVTKRDDGSYRLCHQDFDTFDVKDNHGLLEHARKIAGDLRAALQLDIARPVQLDVGTLFAFGPNGEISQFVEIKGITINLTPGHIYVAAAKADAVALPVAQPKPFQVARLAEADGAVAKVLRLMSNGDRSSWSGLYRIYEVIQGDTGGDISKLIAPSSRARLFKRSANSVAVGGDASRHGAENTVPPPNPMTLGEAQSFVRELLDSWFASKGVQ